MNKITLPGSIPGLLRRCSPVLIGAGLEGIVRQVKDNHESLVYCFGRIDFFRNCEISLDLDDETGKQHAIWWLQDHGVKIPRDHRAYESTNVQHAVISEYNNQKKTAKSD